MKGTFQEPIPYAALLLSVCFRSLDLSLEISLPPVQDYPHHFARYWLIAGGASVLPTSSMFANDWRNAPANVGPAPTETTV
jgi:hypothetical protein